MSANRLREAAKVLRDRAEDATPGPWTIVSGASNVWHLPDDGTPTVVVPGNGTQGRHVRLEDAAYIATMHPGVGLALADWLDEMADHGASDLMPMERGAFVIADLILGGEGQ